LIEHFLKKYSQETTKRVDHVTRDAVALMGSYDWPGNVRELANAVERAVVLSKSRTLSREDFSFLSPASMTGTGSRSLLNMEKDYIRQILEESGWNITKASKILNINRVTLHKKIKRYDLIRRT
jgi:two-component system response regulator HydG